MAFRFLEDIATADVAFEAFGGTREELFISAAAALLRTMAAAPERVERRQELTIRLENQELDLLLWSFLQELIFYKDARRLLLHADTVRIEEREGGFSLESTLSGEQLSTDRHRLLVDVKAVTLHRLQVVYKDTIWKAVVVLDV
ncbi:MAG: archease [Desulfuromonadaceae bacterium]|nr:archease [Desulfuromonadaceae bacterium]